ncbi:MAG TPA: CHC2 zinc finger domain-containing protein, partial [Polyangiales bacterium]|nr:CHC2 zinc finger domain-containing protein [Polyangiales bacterium]
MARHHKKPKSTRTQFDINRIKQDLTILDALDGLGVAFTSHGDKRISCPIHNGDDGSFSIFDGDDGQRWRCHSQCQTSGDVIDLIEAIEKLEPGAAIRRAAELLGIEPTVEVDPFLAIAREATRGAKRVADAARRAEAEQLRASANVRDATELWIKLTREGYVGPNMFDAPIAPRSRVCADYLRNRKLDGAINATRWLVLAAAEDGSPVVPIYTIARDVCPYLDNGVINCVTRHLSGAKLGLTGHTTKGTYGRSAALVGMDATDARPVRLVLVEGLT